MLGSDKRTTALANDIDGPRSLPAPAGDLTRLTGRSRLGRDISVSAATDSNELKPAGRGKSKRPLRGV